MPKACGVEVIHRHFCVVKVLPVSAARVTRSLVIRHRAVFWITIDA